MATRYRKVVFPWKTGSRSVSHTVTNEPQEPVGYECLFCQRLVIEMQSVVWVRIGHSTEKCVMHGACVRLVASQLEPGLNDQDVIKATVIRGVTQSAEGMIAEMEDFLKVEVN